MTRRVVSTHRADEDIESAIVYYLEGGAAEAADGFVDAVQEVRDLLSAHPSLGSSRFAVDIGIADIRTMALEKFPYVVFYTDDADAVRIHRVLHTRRDIPSEFPLT